MANIGGRNTGRMWHGNGALVMVAPHGEWGVWPSQATHHNISITDTIECVVS